MDISLSEPDSPFRPKNSLPQYQEHGLMLVLSSVLPRKGSCLNQAYTQARGRASGWWLWGKKGVAPLLQLEKPWNGNPSPRAPCGIHRGLCCYCSEFDLPFCPVPLHYNPASHTPSKLVLARELPRNFPACKCRSRICFLWSQPKAYDKYPSNIAIPCSIRLYPNDLNQIFFIALLTAWH